MFVTHNHNNNKKRYKNSKVNEFTTQDYDIYNEYSDNNDDTDVSNLDENEIQSFLLFFSSQFSMSDIFFYCQIIFSIVFQLSIFNVRHIRKY